MNLEVFSLNVPLCVSDYTNNYFWKEEEKVSRVVCGILSVVIALISWVIFWWLSIVAIVIGVVGFLLNREVDETNTKNRVLVGTTLNASGIILAAVGLIIFLIALAVLI